jgi:phytoene dehydrogenase-like protein
MTNQYMELKSEGAKDTIAIIGGGLAGLTAAVILSQKGKNVTVIEKSSDLGGRARTTFKDGFYFNQGPHALYPAGSGPMILDELNVKYNGNRVDPKNYFVIKKDKTYPLPIKLNQLLTTKLLSGVKSKVEIIRFFMNLNKINLNKLDSTSFQDWLDYSFQNSDSKDFVRMLSRLATYTYNAETMSAKMALYQIKTALTGGVLYIDGGWQTLVNQLSETAKSNGTIFLRGKNVISVEKSNDHYTDAIHGDGGGTNDQTEWKIRLSGDIVLSFDNVIIATDPTQAYSLLKRIVTIKPAFLQQLEKMNKPSRVATLDIALSKLPNPNVYGAYGMDSPMYLSLHSAFAKLATGENGALFHAMKYLDSSAEPNPQQDRLELENLLDMIQPGWRNLVVRQRFMPNMIASNTVLYHTEGRILEQRPDFNVPGVGNLYIIGDWVGPEGMLADTSFASAKAAAVQILSESESIIIQNQS